MRIVSWAIRLTLFLLLVALAAKNVEPVTLRFYFDKTAQAPLIVVLFAAFALGSLFRRRGEYDRAIRMHQNLLERADLGSEQKASALAELGEDYLKAGILDRAEEVFIKLEKTNFASKAKKHLLEIYEQEKD